MTDKSTIYRKELLAIFEQARDSKHGIRIDCDPQDIDAIRRKFYAVRKAERENGNDSFERLVFRIGTDDNLYLIHLPQEQK